MRQNRRDFLGCSGIGIVSVLSHDVVFCRESSIQIGMCDWNLGRSCDPANIPKARQAHLQGIQVSVAVDAGNVPLRDPKVRETFLRLGREQGITFHSVAAGILNRIPLKSEPQAAILAIDALEAAAALGSANILLAFFDRGDLRARDASGGFIGSSSGRFKSYALDEEGVTRVVEALRHMAPRAEKCGVVIGIEDTLSAPQNLDLLERIGSPMVQVYYDLGNSTEYGYDVPSEIRLLGKSRICEVHLKDWKTPLLGSPGGAVDFAAAAQACKDIGFDKWYVLETSGRKGRFLEDTRANVEFARRLFA